VINLVCVRVWLSKTNHNHRENHHADFNPRLLRWILIVH